MSLLNFTGTTPSQHGNASPSIALERGNYRMRAPIPRPPPLLLQEVGQGRVPLVRKSPQHRLNRSLALLLMLLTLACMSCFATAYYLFTSRWEFRAISPPYVPSNSASQVNASDEDNPRLDPSEKFLTYLPHSGFHNQRIAFENALLLSYLLRRTLLVPPIRLGNRPIRYVEYDTLLRFHELSSKEGLRHCLDVPVYISRPLECLEYFETTFLPWTWLVDLSAVAAHQPLQQRPNMSQTWLQVKLNIELSDIHTLRDDSPYRFRFLDSYDDSSPLHRYQEDIYIADLGLVHQRLLQIGTLFGSSRIHLKRAENLNYHQIIRQNMKFKNNDLTEVANRISRFLKYSYIGVHLRTGDGKFKQKLETTLRLVWWEVMDSILGFSTSEICDLGKSILRGSSSSLCNPPLPSENRSFFSPLSAFSQSSRSYGVPCRSSRHRDPRHQALNTPVYIATDLKDPESHPLMSVFLQTFPCLFFIEDFEKEIAPLETLKSPYDGVGLYPYILPFIDALVLGKALRVVGTESSTFSKFVQEILWANTTAVVDN